MPQPRVFHLLQQAHSSLFRAADHALRQRVGLTASQQGVLFLLTKRNGAPISAIADELRMGRSSLTQLIDRMTDKGLVRRQRCAEDARSFEVHIEDGGRRAVADTLADVKRINSALLAPFSAKEQAAIEAFLTHVTAHAGEIVAQQLRSSNDANQSIRR